MSQPQRKAAFFVSPSGDVIPKAPAFPQSQRRRIFDRDGWKCRKCGQDVAFNGNTCSPFRTPPGAIDHIFPRSRGGQNNDENLQLLCISCNSAKGAS